MRAKIFWVVLPDLLCTVASKASYISIAWWVLNTKESVIEFALIVSMATLFEALLIPVLSPINDKYGHKKVYGFSVLFCVLISIVIACSYFIFYDHFFIVVLFALLVTIITSSIRDSGLNGVINSTIDPDEIEKAVRYKLSINTVVSIVAPPLGAFASSLGGIALVGIASFLSYLLSIIVIKLYWVKDDFCLENNDYLMDFKAGLKATYRVKTELYIGIFSALVNFIVAPFFSVLLPFFVFKTSGMTVVDLGFFEAYYAFGFFVGASAGVATITNIFNKKICILIGYLGFSLSMLCFAYNNNMEVLCVAMVVSGFSLPLINTHLITMRILATPDNFVSRISGAVAGLCMIAIPIGNIVVGVLITIVDFKTIFSIFAFLILIMIFLFKYIPNIIYILSHENEEDVVDLYKKLYPDAFI